MLRSLLTFACVWLVASACCAAESPKITIAGQVFDTFGKRVSKAGIARLAQITPTGVRITDANTYLPAEEVLLVGKKDRRGQRFFEVWERFQYASGDCTAIQLTSITAYDDEDNGGERGELTSTSARNLGLGTSGTQLFPSYSCDREYFRAVEHLKSADGRLSHETATLVVTYIMRLDGKGTGIKVCDNNASF